MPLRFKNWRQWGNALTGHDAQSYENALIDHDQGLPLRTPVLASWLVFKHWLGLLVSIPMGHPETLKAEAPRRCYPGCCGHAHGGGC